jgi:ribose transport system ATP-binding protein
MQIVMKNINKSFGGIQVLHNAGLAIADSEIHALVGENGAGKSTLMKILTGVYTRDSGQILVNGEEVEYTHPKQAEAQGIVFIYQELNVMFDLTVEENMFLGKEIKKQFGILDKNAMKSEAKKVLDRLGVEIPVDCPMSELSVGQQQMVEIAKALMVDAKVIIMDEPTAALTPKETEVLFKVMRSLKEKGVSIVYISHRMEEIFELCDRITVLRDGEFIGSKDIGDTDMNDLVKMMIGRDIGERFPKRNCTQGEVVMSVKNFTKNGVFNNVSFSVKAGEVLGVAGLMGAGRTEIMQSIFGNLPYDSGSLEIMGKPVHIHSPEQAKKLGIGFITEDRKTEGLMLEETIKKNVALTNLSSISKNGVLDKDKENNLVDKAIKELSIHCFGPSHICSNLSGGNQQKVVFAKWIYINPKVLILDEPTRGVDIGAKKEIYTIINKLAESGVAIIMVSSELPEVLGMSDRVMVVHEGRVGGFLDSGEIKNIVPQKQATQENVMILATGGTL